MASPNYDEMMDICGPDECYDFGNSTIDFGNINWDAATLPTAFEAGGNAQAWSGDIDMSGYAQTEQPGVEPQVSSPFSNLWGDSSHQEQQKIPSPFAFGLPDVLLPQTPPPAQVPSVENLFAVAGQANPNPITDLSSWLQQESRQVTSQEEGWFDKLMNDAGQQLQQENQQLPSPFSRPNFEEPPQAGTVLNSNFPMLSAIGQQTWNAPPPNMLTCPPQRKQQGESRYDWYHKLPKRNDWQSDNGTTIRYNAHTGELDYSLTFNKPSFLSYLRGCNQYGFDAKLIIRNTCFGEKSKLAAPHASLKCRYAGCPKSTNTIEKGFWMLSVDEHYGATSSGQYSPYHVAANFHLHCVEKMCDLRELSTIVPVVAETRVFAKEEKNPFGIDRDTHKVVESWEAWCHAANNRCPPGSAVQYQPLPRFQDRLCSHLTEAHLAAQSQSRFKVRNDRGGAHIEWHRGDLDLYVEGKDNLRKVGQAGDDASKELLRRVRHDYLQRKPFAAPPVSSYPVENHNWALPDGLPQAAPYQAQAPQLDGFAALLFSDASPHGSQSIHGQIEQRQGSFIDAFAGQLLADVESHSLGNTLHGQTSPTSAPPQSPFSLLSPELHQQPSQSINEQAAQAVAQSPVLDGLFCASPASIASPFSAGVSMPQPLPAGPTHPTWRAEHEAGLLKMAMKTAPELVEMEDVEMTGVSPPTRARTLSLNRSYSVDFNRDWATQPRRATY